MGIHKNIRIAILGNKCRIVLTVFVLWATTIWPTFVAADSLCGNAHPGAKPVKLTPNGSSKLPSRFSRSLVDKAQKNTIVRILVGLNIARTESKAPANDPKTQRLLTFLQDAILEKMRGTKTTLVTKFKSTPYMVLDVDANALSILMRLPVINSITEYLPTLVSIKLPDLVQIQYIDVAGTSFNLILKLYKNSDDPKGIYLVLDTFCIAEKTPNCLSNFNKTPQKMSFALLQDNIDIKLQGLELSGKPNYVYLKRYNNPKDKKNFYWKLENYREIT